MLLNQDGSPFPGYWTMDYPRSDRHLLEGVRRLTRIDSRSVEQVVSFDGSDDMFNYPMLYAVEVGHWRLHDDNAKQLREFLSSAAVSSWSTISTARPNGTSSSKAWIKYFRIARLWEIDQREPDFSHAL